MTKIKDALASVFSSGGYGAKSHRYCMGFFKAPKPHPCGFRAYYNEMPKKSKGKLTVNN
jgi:hypothetical protein